MTEPVVPLFRPSQAVTIVATSRRPRNSSSYFAVMSQATATRLGVAGVAVLVFQHPALDHSAALQPRKLRYLAIHCRVHIDDTATNARIAAGAVAVDQTLRNALGVPFRAFAELDSRAFFILPAKRRWSDRLRRITGEQFGIRDLAVRSQPSSVPDIEKRYVRLPAELLTALGALEASDIVIERPLPVVEGGQITSFVIGSGRLSALVAGDAYLAQREKLREAFPKRYPNAQSLLYDYASFVAAGQLPASFVTTAASVPEPDVPPIFMDADARSLDVATSGALPIDNEPLWLATDGLKGPSADFLTPYLVRRSIRSTLARDSIQTGIAFLLAMLQVTLLLDIDAAGLSVREFLVAFGLALVLTTLLLVARLRQQV